MIQTLFLIAIAAMACYKAWHNSQEWMQVVWFGVAVTCILVSVYAEKEVKG